MGSVAVAGPSLGTMESDSQYLYGAGMGSVPCGWSRRGACDMGRLISRREGGHAAHDAGALPRRRAAGVTERPASCARWNERGRGPRRWCNPSVAAGSCPILPAWDRWGPRVARSRLGLGHGLLGCGSLCPINFTPSKAFCGFEFVEPARSWGLFALSAPVLIALS